MMEMSGSSSQIYTATKIWKPWQTFIRKADWLVLLVVVFMTLMNWASADLVNAYEPILSIQKSEMAEDMPLDADLLKEPADNNAPEQVHITQGNFNGKDMTISWVTPEKQESSHVLYGTESGNYSYKAMGITTRYIFFNYSSGYIHHCTLHDLKYETKYYYTLGYGTSIREFWFMTPPPPGPYAPYTFGIIGNLGQTSESNRTLEHYMRSMGQTVLYVGDMSYADNYPYHDNRRWDAWARFIQPSAAYQPWMFATGNHEIGFGSDFGEERTFKAFKHRFVTPHRSSNSTSSLYYSFERGPAHVIVLSSYTGFVKHTPQYAWLGTDLKNVDRERTPWLIVLMHVPMYSSNSNHYMEGEAMRSVFEAMFVEYKVDIVYAGHPHGYERMHPVTNTEYNISNGLCSSKLVKTAPQYFVVGNGGHKSGLTSSYIDPQPSYSAFRDVSLGYAILEIRNSTHALHYWHKNQDDDAAKTDPYWIENRYWMGDLAK